MEVFTIAVFGTVSSVLGDKVKGTFHFHGILLLFFFYGLEFSLVTEMSC